MPRAHLSRFLALVGYRSRKWIVNSEWHFLRDFNQCLRDIKPVYFNESKEQVRGYMTRNAPPSIPRVVSDAKTNDALLRLNQSYGKITTNHFKIEKHSNLQAFLTSPIPYYSTPLCGEFLP